MILGENVTLNEPQVFTVSSYFTAKIVTVLVYHLKTQWALNVYLQFSYRRSLSYGKFTATVKIQRVTPKPNLYKVCKVTPMYSGQ